MPKPEPLCRIIGINPKKIKFQEMILLELELYIRIEKELKEIMREEHREYFRLIKLSVDKEKEMIDSSLTRKIIEDILITNEYTIDGIARYTYTCIEVIQQIISGRIEPSITLFRKLLELHRSVRTDIYAKVIERIRIELNESSEPA